MKVFLPTVKTTASSGFPFISSGVNVWDDDINKVFFINIKNDTRRRISWGRLNVWFYKFVLPKKKKNTYGKNVWYPLQLGTPEGLGVWLARGEGLWLALGLRETGKQSDDISSQTRK